MVYLESTLKRSYLEVAGSGGRFQDNGNGSSDRKDFDDENEWLFYGDISCPKMRQGSV